MSLKLWKDSMVESKMDIMKVSPHYQNEELKLNMQLPDSELDFNSDFSHPDEVSCKVYSIKGTIERNSSAGKKKCF